MTLKYHFLFTCKYLNVIDFTNFFIYLLLWMLLYVEISISRCQKLTFSFFLLMVPFIINVVCVFNCKVCNVKANLSSFKVGYRCLNFMHFDIYLGKYMNLYPAFYLSNLHIIRSKTLKKFYITFFLDHIGATGFFSILQLLFDTLCFVLWFLWFIWLLPKKVSDDYAFGGVFINFVASKFTYLSYNKP